MKKAAVLSWAVACWFVPAGLAAALGFDAVWGGPRVFSDYAMPLPVAGGFLHVLSLGLTIGVLLVGRLLPRSWASLVWGLFVAEGLVGLSLLCDVAGLAAERLSGGGLSLRWQENPLGLFLLNDAVFALLWVAFTPHLRPTRDAKTVVAAVLATLPALALVGLLAKQDPRLRSPFLPAALLSRGHDGALGAFYTRLDIASPEVRAEAERALAELAPVGGLVQARAAFFFRDLDAARLTRDGTGALATYCYYADGTPSVWHEGRGDCFALRAER